MLARMGLMGMDVRTVMGWLSAFAIAAACGSDDRSGTVEPATTGDDGSAADDGSADDGIDGGDSTGTPPLELQPLGEIDSHALGREPVSVLPVDVNGDGALDLVVAHQASVGQLRVLLGNGDGTFAAPVVQELPNSLMGAVAGDFDDDGVIDLALGEEIIGAVTIATGDGTGAFTRGEPAMVDGFVSALAAADVQGDGIPEVVVGVRGMEGAGGRLALLATDGGLETLAMLGDAAVAVVPGDFDGDGDLDLAATLGQSFAVAHLHGDGSGTFTALADVDGGIWLGDAVALDLLGDGTRHFAASSLVEGTIVLFGAPPSPDAPFGAAQAFESPVGPFAVAAADIDDDGRDDLVVSGVSTSELVVHRGGAGTLGEPQLWASFPGAQRLGSLAVADLDGDGDSDVALLERGTIDTDGTLHVLRNDG